MEKNARRWKTWILFYDESGISQRPSIRRTWAPRGQTPLLIHRFNWKKLLVCAALGFRWNGRRHQLWFRTAPGDCNRHRVLAILKALAYHMRGRRVILIWTNCRPTRVSWSVTGSTRSDTGCGSNACGIPPPT